MFWNWPAISPAGMRRRADRSASTLGICGWLPSSPGREMSGELANFIRRAVALCPLGRNWPGSLRPREESARATAPRPGVEGGFVAGGNGAAGFFEVTLDATGGNRARAAEMLGVSLRTVRNKVREFGLPPRGNYRTGYRSNNETTYVHE